VAPQQPQPERGYLYQRREAAAPAVPPSFDPTPACPRAGFEIELTNCQLINLSDSQGSAYSGTAASVWAKLTQKDATYEDFERVKGMIEGQVRGAHLDLTTFRDQKLALQYLDQIRPIGYAKRTKLFGSPHGFWSATADSVGSPFQSRLEFVTEPLTWQEWHSREAQEDLEALDAVGVELYRISQGGELFQLSRLTTRGIKVFHPEAFLVFDDSPCRADLQMTRQRPILTGRLTVTDQMRLQGLNGSALPLLLSTMETFLRPSYGGENPKEAFNNLPKTPLNLALGRPDPPPDHEQLDEWIAAVAKAARVPNLDDSATSGLESAWREKGRPLAMAIHPAGFTWRQFLRALVLDNRDLLAEWSSTGFGGVEDFGYATIPVQPRPGWAIYELRRAPIGRGRDFDVNLGDEPVLSDLLGDALKLWFEKDCSGDAQSVLTGCAPVSSVLSPPVAAAAAASQDADDPTWKGKGPKASNNRTD
jgi:hypothetical protein